MGTPPIPHVAGALAVAPRPAERRCRSALLGRGWEGPPISACLDRHRGRWRCTSPSSPPPGGPSRPAIPCGKATASRDGLVKNTSSAMPEQPDGQPVGHRVLRRLEAAPEPPSREGLLVWERPEGAGPGVRKRARPRTRSRPSDCRVAPSPVRVSPAAPAARDSEAQDLCAQQPPSPRRCARPGRRGAHRHPLSISQAYTAMTHGAGGAQIIGRGLPRGEPSAMCRRVASAPAGRRARSVLSP